jgi:hypothetical protein
LSEAGNFSLNPFARTDNTVKNVFYSKIRKEIRRINTLLAEIPKYKSKHIASSFPNNPDIRISKSSYLKMLKVMKVSVLELEKVHINTIGEQVLQMSAKKRRKSPPSPSRKPEMKEGSIEKSVYSPCISIIRIVRPKEELCHQNHRMQIMTIIPCPSRMSYILSWYTSIALKNLGQRRKYFQRAK